MTAQLVAQHIAILANKTAESLAERARVDRELRNAMQLMKLDTNTVRVGGYDIRRQDADFGPIFSIRNARDGQIVVQDMVFYETCQAIVDLLNEGYSRLSIPVVSYVRKNDQYRRLETDIEIYRAQISHYESTNQCSTEMENRLFVIEDRLLDAMSKAELLRHQLLPRT